jgi:flavin-binding protein dodecin
MSVARVTEISARSTQSFEAAINEGIERANQTLRNVRSAWIRSSRSTSPMAGSWPIGSTCW